MTHKKFRSWVHKTIRGRFEDKHKVEHWWRSAYPNNDQRNRSRHKTIAPQLTLSSSQFSLTRTVVGFAARREVRRAHGVERSSAPNPLGRGGGGGGKGALTTACTGTRYLEGPGVTKEL